MLTYDNSVTFMRGETPIVSLAKFWEPEDGFVWSSGRWCEIGFDFELDKSKIATAELIVDMHAFISQPDLPGQHFFFYLNGLRIGSAFINRRVTTVFPFSAPTLKATENVLVIDCPDIASPGDFGLPDLRLLGIQLFSLQIRKVE